MKLVFRGWSRTMYSHEHEVLPLDRRGRYLGSGDGRLEWSDAFTAYGKISSLGLTGNFKVSFEFSEGELENWMRTYASNNPEAAVRLFGAMYSEAVVALASGPARGTEEP